MVVIYINVTNDCSIKTITVHWLDIKFDIRIQHESEKMLDSKPHPYIDFMSSQCTVIVYKLYYIDSVSDKDWIVDAIYFFSCSIFIFFILMSHLSAPDIGN